MKKLKFQNGTECYSAAKAEHALTADHWLSLLLLGVVLLVLKMLPWIIQG